MEREGGGRAGSEPRFYAPLIPASHSYDVNFPRLSYNRLAEIEQQPQQRTVRGEKERTGGEK